MDGTAIVTGASSGIGWATAELLADRGLVVINLDIAPFTTGWTSRIRRQRRRS
jgi:NAD(P)-dependent dehydrogenase (short-subunit alcohol dehydrogenase family)